MAYRDMHVRFRVPEAEARRLGYSGVAIAQDMISEKTVKGAADFSSDVPKDKISILTGADTELLRKGVKRYDVIFVSSFYPDTALMREVAEEGKAFEIPISGLLRSYGYSRAALLSRIQFFLEMCVKYRADYCITSRAESIHEMKSIDEMVSIAWALGLTPQQAKRSMSAVAEKILEKVK